MISGVSVHYSSNTTAVRLGGQQPLQSSPQHSVEPINAPQLSTASEAQHLTVESASVPQHETHTIPSSLDTATPVVCVSLPSTINSISTNPEVISASLAVSFNEGLSSEHSIVPPCVSVTNENFSCASLAVH